MPVNYYLRRGVISLYHDSPIAGHLGISNMTWAIACDYWWHNVKQTIMDYIKGYSSTIQQSSGFSLFVPHVDRDGDFH
jgi:hypothetical protein